MDPYWTEWPDRHKTKPPAGDLLLPATEGRAPSWDRSQWCLSEPIRHPVLGIYQTNRTFSGYSKDMNRLPFLWVALAVGPWIACGDTPTPTPTADTSVAPDGSVDAANDSSPASDEAPSPIDVLADDGQAASDSGPVDDTNPIEDNGGGDAPQDASDQGAADQSVTPPDTGPDVPSGPPCETALTLEAPAAIATVEYANLVAGGGTGQYRFALIADGSGAIVNELSGA